MPWNQPPRRTVSAAAKANAPALRKRLTSAERQLWRELRALRSELGGTHFRRQVPIGPYIADFCCLGQRLIIEIDGEIHRQAKAVAYDRQRDDYLHNEGFRVLRFSNRDISLGMAFVAKAISAALVVSTPTPGPSPQGGGELQRATP
ncbi:MAG TPA: endonuclease domain-containing protein [Rhizobiaceae bacterium]|nr:endonuclease domain-containing protein [Rhizobiaceae bacterium]